MVKQYGQLYLDTRHALLETEDAQTAGMMARQLLCHFSGKDFAFQTVVSQNETGVFIRKFAIQPFLAIDIDFFIVIDHIPP